MELPAWQREVGKHGGRPGERGPVLVCGEVGTWCERDGTTPSVIGVNGLHGRAGSLECKTPSVLESAAESTRKSSAGTSDISHKHRSQRLGAPPAHGSP